MIALVNIHHTRVSGTVTSKPHVVAVSSEGSEHGHLENHLLLNTGFIVFLKKIRKNLNSKWLKFPN